MTYHNLNDGGRDGPRTLKNFNQLTRMPEKILLKCVIMKASYHTHYEVVERTSGNSVKLNYLFMSVD
jgi:hypothetical protein